jgi:hypothetical protein
VSDRGEYQVPAMVSEELERLYGEEARRQVAASGAARRPRPSVRRYPLAALALLIVVFAAIPAMLENSWLVGAAVGLVTVVSPLAAAAAVQLGRVLLRHVAD